jgi:hypothetical protein
VILFRLSLTANEEKRSAAASGTRAACSENLSRYLPVERAGAKSTTLQLFSEVSAVPPLNGVEQLNVVLNRYLSPGFMNKPLVQLFRMFSKR